jgi:hypothetical protein
MSPGSAGGADVRVVDNYDRLDHHGDAIRLYAAIAGWRPRIDEQVDGFAGPLLAPAMVCKAGSSSRQRSIVDASG